MGIFILRIVFGSEGFISPLTNDVIDHNILLQLRAPRAVLGLISGLVLGLSGLYFQGIFRNNLASPYTLGVSTCTLGVSIYNLGVWTQTQSRGGDKQFNFLWPL